MKKRVLIIAVLLAACRNEPKTVEVAVDENENWSATLPDGTEVTNEEEYSTAIADQTGPIESMEPLALTIKTSNKADGGAAGFTFGKFNVGIQVDTSYLSGCVNRSFLHLKVSVQNNKLPANMVELHLLGWFDSKKPCIAVMNTGFIGYGWCYKMCMSDPKGGLRSGIKNGLIAAGVAVGTAAIISAVVTPVASVALAI